MNEHETNPQRHENSSSEEQSHRPADAFPAGSSPERGQSDATAPQPVVSQPASWQAQPQPPASPWQQGPQQPVPGQPYPAQQYPQTAPQPAYAGGYQGPQPGQEQWNSAPRADAPIWAASVGSEPERDPARSGRGRRTLVTGALALLIALGAGGVGAATALALHDDSRPATLQTANSPVTRVVDRSSLAQIVSAVKDSVVSITTGSGEGSGVVLNDQGFIVTNNHVVATAQGKTVTVIFANGKKAEGTITGTDPRTDLAVVKVDGVDDLKPAKLGSSAGMQVGDTVLAIGSPLGLEGSVTEGIISAKDRTIQSGGEDQQTPQNPFGGQQQQSQGTQSMSGLLQTDAPINPGNSGGALVNTNGEVIGINSAIATSGSSNGNIGLGFAIPSDKVQSVVQALMKGEKVSHPALGVSVTEAEGGGAQVSLVSPNSAAAKAGIEQGDVIKSVNGKAVNDSDDLVGIIQAAKVGDKVSITFARNGQEQTVNATLAEAS
ncbi:trypsin-like peptidase domain-containing protein [Actinoplanes sp. NPDC049548]|uniref:S1C family serine protease n=1 Tax=Actinoplanes sp. NPDC049548 TaxID=3155152 RepID=UPI003438660B